MKEHPVSKNVHIPAPLKKLANAYFDKNFIIYLVGGAVRDILLNDIPNDYDFVSDATTDETIKIMEELGCKIYYKGKRFGIISGSIEDIKIEIGTFRKDVTDDRLPIVDFNVTILDDANRRDITYNALYYDFNRCVILDYVGGIDDMNNKITKMVGDPVLRINQDKLRILRVIRYACKYNHAIDIDTKNAIQNSDLCDISKERIYEEIIRSFQCTDFHQYLTYMKELNLFKHVFPDMNVVYDMDIKSKYLPIYFAYMFKNTDHLSTGLKNLKYDRLLIKQTKFLINMLYFNPFLICKFLKKKKQYHLDNNMLIEWNELMNLDNYQQKFITYQTIIKKDFVENLIKQGYNGKDLSNKLDQLEYEHFLYYCN
ncbi:polyA polymerase head RNA and srmB- binding domain protein [Fadolivirus algeromassiliense]|jgi:tRNA nucleotidyltransferase/poly(A) polymerase|uniref:PolyA polymerase head RNA and srmB- binding domain protein n=1 Tax=Fadolivirus FV1/VV64 TaxID=3070911 RepID=A0A7D3R152_9VIRU|nr:polyA polymerase head RNA and srmB- binding domain protein [Fadolivirus algeromassiliense]QKF94202.1 polyA polymerase head RNA and srmB- binding domain protein [Fadolivirus FV1/VV64]